METPNSGLAKLGYRAVALDLRGYGDTDAPAEVSSYTCFHLVRDLVALIDIVAADQEKVFVVGHDCGAILAWYLRRFRPDRVKVLVNLSVQFLPRHPQMSLLGIVKGAYGDDYYMCRFQEPGEMEAEFAQSGTAGVIRELLTSRNSGPLFIPKGRRFGVAPIALPSWLSEDEVNYYITKFEKTGFTGGINYYRNLDQNWELTAPWANAQVTVPVKFIVGDEDLDYNSMGGKDFIEHGEFKKHVPFLEEVVGMNGAAHFINQEKGEEISQHIYDFIKKFE